MPEIRLLLVDDNPDDRRLALRALDREFGPLAVVEPIDAATFNDAIATGPYDLLVTDFNLRWTDGLEVVSKVKQAFPGCATVMFTGTGGEEIAVEAMKRGLDDYVVKSARHLARLPAAARAALERARANELERERDRAWATLRVGEARLRAILEAVPNGIVVTDGEGRMLLVNQELERMTGWSRGELLGVSVEWLVPPGARDQHARDRASYLGGPERARMMGAGRVLEVACADGGTLPVEIGLNHFSSSDERFGVAVITDVSERRRLEEALAHSQRLEALGSLAGGIAHDINNVLTAIAGHGELLELQLADDDPRRHHAAEILRISARAGEITRRLLAFGRRQAIAVRGVSVAEVIRETADMIRPLLDASIELETRLDGDAGLVNADPGQLQQILTNLVLNARDAMPRGGRIAVALSRRTVDPGPVVGRRLGPGEYVVLEVEDDGTGMPADVAARVFEPFFTTKAQGEGTGLGLSIVYGTVRQLGGDVGVESAPGEGTRFTVLLPLLLPEEQPEEAPAPVAVEPSGAARVLVVDDDEVVRDVIVTGLRLGGHDVVAAADGDQALGILLTDGASIQVMLSDVQMPGLPAAELLARAREAHPHLRVIVTSGAQDSVLQGFGDAVAVLPKPFSMRDLNASVDRALGEG